jgi:uncharacterized membrane protein SpoIIM required for sporulation
MPLARILRVMVFDKFKVLGLAERKKNIFYIAFISSLIGIAVAFFIFPESLGLISIAFTAILLVPVLNDLLKLEENVERRQKTFSIRQVLLDHKDIIWIYLVMFFAIMLAYSLIGIYMSEAGLTTYFPIQLSNTGYQGFALNDLDFANLLINNLSILIISFFLSLIYGAGSVLFLAWNASVWGIIFAFFVKKTAAVSGLSTIAAFFSLAIPLLPHMITEALAYITAAIVGGIVSKAVLRERLFSQKFYHVMKDSVMFLIISIILVMLAALIEVFIYSG